MLTRAALPFVVASGLCEVGGFACYALGSRHGIAVAAVLASQFAAVAAVAAYLLFHERLTRLQLAGVIAILAGVAGAHGAPGVMVLSRDSSRLRSMELRSPRGRSR